MFDLRLHDRLGEYPVSNQPDEDADYMWGRIVLSAGSSRFSEQALKSDNYLQLVQIGKNLNQSTSDKRGDKTQWGIMASYAKARNSIASTATTDTSKGKVRGILFGLYGTWHEYDTPYRGWYADSWVQYGRFKNSVSGSELAQENYSYNGTAVSLEIGNTIGLSSSDEQYDKRKYYLQPQGQVIFGNIGGLDYIESNGTRITSDSNSNWQSRLGFKLLGTRLTELKNRDSGYLSAYWLHNSRNVSVRTEDGALSTLGTRNILEIKGGFDAEVSKNLTLWGNLAWQKGSRNYRNVIGSLNLKYTF